MTDKKETSALFDIVNMVVTPMSSSTDSSVSEVYLATSTGHFARFVVGNGDLSTAELTLGQYLSATQHHAYSTGRKSFRADFGSKKEI